MKHRILWAFVLSVNFLLFTSCNNDDEGLPPTTSINDFIWKSMNLWYFWQSQVPNLADDRFSSNSEYEQFLQSQDPAQLFYGLLYDYGNTDRFSWIVDDYHALENQFAGINVSFGMDYGFVLYNENSGQVFGYVQYVIPNSPAFNSGIKRGDIFTKINGTVLTQSNYLQLISGNTLTFGLGYLENGELHHSNEEITLTKTQIQENPIYQMEVFNLNGIRIGYLVYNAFRANFNYELNQAFGILKNYNIDELILDLRYNGGGSVQTASYLGSMITGQFLNQPFTHLTFNQKTSNNNISYYFGNYGKDYDDQLNEIGTFQLQHLNLSKLYVITSRNTASASEMLIGCLAPYIQVQTIGTRTYGKTVGSITLYDSPSTYFTSSQNVNPSHKWALQPIVFDYKNAQHQSGPTFGILPDYEINEIHYLENLPELGDLNEPLLNAAISMITPPKTSPLQPKNFQLRHLKSSQMLERFGMEMYLDKGVELIP